MVRSIRVVAVAALALVAQLAGAAAAATCPKGSLTSADGKVCCPASCTKCGGDACDKLPGGAAKCCSGNITRSKKTCGTPPCVLPTPGPPASKHCGSDKSGIFSSDGKVCCAASCKTCSCDDPDRDSLCCPDQIKSRDKGCGVPPCVIKGAGGPNCIGSQQPCGYTAFGGYGIPIKPATTCCAASKTCFRAPCNDGKAVCQAGVTRTVCDTELKCPEGGTPCGWDSDDVFDPTARPRSKSTTCCKKGEFCNAYDVWRRSPETRCAPTKVCNDRSRRCGYAYFASYVAAEKVYTPYGVTDPTYCCDRPGMCKIEPQPTKDAKTSKLMFHMRCVEPKKCPAGQTPCGRRYFSMPDGFAEEYSNDTTCCTSAQKCVRVQDPPFKNVSNSQYTYKCKAK